MAKISKKQIGLIGFSLIIFFGLLMIIYYNESQKPPLQKSAATVDVMKVKSTDYNDTINALGHVTSENGIILKANVSGPITNIKVKSGQSVKKGDVLIEINPDSIKANLSYNQAQTKLDKLNLDRYKSLYQKNAVSKEELDTAETNYQKDLAEEKIILAELHDAVIQAPFDGTIGIIQPKIGEYVNQGDELFSLQTTTPIYVDFSLPSKYQGEVKLNQKVSVKLDAYPKDKIQGAVTAIDNVINKDSNSLLIRATFPNNNHLLLSGDLVDATLITKENKNTIILPSEAVVYDTDQTYVYTVSNNHAIKQKVTLGQEVGQNGIIIKSGLKNNEEIVSAGASKLSNNMEVKVLNKIS